MNVSMEWDWKINGPCVEALWVRTGVVVGVVACMYAQPARWNKPRVWHVGYRLQG